MAVDFLLHVLFWIQALCCVDTNECATGMKIQRWSLSIRPSLLLVSVQRCQVKEHSFVSLLSVIQLLSSLLLQQSEGLQTGQSQTLMTYLYLFSFLPSAQWFPTGWSRPQCQHWPQCQHCTYQHCVVYQQNQNTDRFLWSSRCLRCNSYQVSNTVSIHFIVEIRHQ